MNITYSNLKGTVRFDSLTFSDCFKASGKTYVNMKSSEEAFCLDDRIVVTFCDEDLVELVRVDVTVSPTNKRK